MARERLTIGGIQYRVQDLILETNHNNFDKFSCTLPVAREDVRGLLGKGGHKYPDHYVEILDKDEITVVFRGFLEKVSDQEQGLGLILEGRDTKVLLLDERTGRDRWINQTGTTIVNDLMQYSTKVTLGSNVLTNLISGTVRFEHQNLLQAIASLCESQNVDFWIESSPQVTYPDPLPGGTGSGTPEDPYTISTIEQLQAISSNLNSHYILVNNIDATITSTWNDGAGFAPIGTSGTPFTGTLNGQGFTISNLYINRPLVNAQGMIAYTGATSVIENIGLINCNVTGYQYVAPLVIFVNGIVKKCWATGTVHGNNNYVGGLISRVNTEVEDCFSLCSISSNGLYVGGFTGLNNTGAHIRRSFAATPITASDGRGFVGLSGGATTTACYYDSDVVGNTNDTSAPARTTAQMQSQENYYQWDFGTTWEMDGYPKLIFPDVYPPTFGEMGFTLHIGNNEIGTIENPNRILSAGTELFEAKTIGAAKDIINRQRVLGAGDGINQIQVCVPYIDVGIPDTARSQGFNGYNEDCLHPVASQSQSEVGIMEGKPYINHTILDTEVAINAAKRILDTSLNQMADNVEVSVSRYIQGLLPGEWCRILDVKKGIDTTNRVKRIVRRFLTNSMIIEFISPNEELASMLAKVQRESLIGDVTGIGATNLISFNFPDICDKDNPYEFVFQMPNEVKFIDRVTMSYVVSGFRAFSGTAEAGGSHSHGIQVRPPFDNSTIGVVGVQTYGMANYLVANTALTSIDTVQASDTHTHPIDFGITVQSASLTDVAILVDDGQGYADVTSTIEDVLGQALSTVQQININMTEFFSADGGIKRIRIVPDGSNDGECRITGLLSIMFYMESR